MIVVGEGAKVKGAELEKNLFWGTLLVSYHRGETHSDGVSLEVSVWVYEDEEGEILSTEIGHRHVKVETKGSLGEGSGNDDEA